MRAVGSKNTTPELAVRSLLHAMGYRYRLHRRDLPGNPDIVLTKYRAVIFVHGCFWHGHSCKRGARQPKTNAEYWREKIKRNEERDTANQNILRCNGWRVLVLWECELKESMTLGTRLASFLG